MTVHVRLSAGITVALALAACSGSKDNGTTAPKLGSINVTVTNTSGAVPHITLSGNGNTYTLTGSQNFTTLQAGTYTLHADSLTATPGIYAPAIARDTATVSTSSGAIELSVVFTKVSLDVQVIVSGLPAGAHAGLRFSNCGPGSPTTVVDTNSVVHLLPGCNHIGVPIVPLNDTSYGWVEEPDTVIIVTAPGPDTIRATYGAWFDSLYVNVSGLPGGVLGTAQITGPFGYANTVSANGKKAVGRLPAGTYTFNWSQASSGGNSYVPGPAVDTQVIFHSTPGVTAVAYTLFDLTIDHAYVTQEVQSPDGSVPLIKGKDGYLRVFGKATVANTVAPKVRVRWYVGASLIRTDTLADPQTSTPVNVYDDSAGFSWDEKISGSFIQPGLAVLTDINPDRAVSEPAANDDFPVNGTPLGLDVAGLDSANIKIVPIDIRGLEPGTPAGGWPAFMGFLSSIHPIPGVQLSVHAMYFSTDNQPLQSGDQNGEWEAILTEVQALEVAESAPKTQHYYGVVHPSYAGGVAGLGYVGAPGAVGWDGSIADQIMAHEIGHNWNRMHSPCGGPSGVDPNYPYPNAIIGQPGFDVVHDVPMPAQTSFDIMGYCQPYWISDYTFEGVLNWRLANEDRAHGGPPITGLDEQPVMIVWGHMRGRELVLEPAFETTARPSRPEGHGEYTIEGLDENGARVFASAFEGVEIADGRRGDRSFAFAIPVAEFDRGRLKSLRASGPSASMDRVGGSIAAAERTGAARAPSKLAARATGGRTASVTWDASEYPLAVVKDARTGEILSLARGGAVRVQVKGAALEVTLSDGVRSARETVHVQP